MRSQERIRGLIRSPKLAWDCILRGRYRFVYDQMPFTLSDMSSQKKVNLLMLEQLPKQILFHPEEGFRRNVRSYRLPNGIQQLQNLQIAILVEEY